ncbi:hypothetical protein NLU13_7912 [Sarocladium strictum]|uniref:Chromo domain-containing protein n=1 Tax=Sarocladium strictum TaxID=5046 RepID=A0AA39GE95_SARSR|nr:hypothetical protein NLU13_7912 [Sarocladium strictum]
MPPPLPEEDSDIEDFDIPVRKRSVKSEESDDPKTQRKGPVGVKDLPGASDVEEGEDEEHEEDEGDEEKGDDEVYVIEAIRKHMVDEDGTLKFQVKWEGWDKKSDLTWEPETTLREDAEEVLDAYLESIGGREAIFEQSEKATKTKKRGRQPSSGAGAAAPKRPRKNGVHPADTAPPATSKKWAPPAGSWEDLVENVEASQDETTGKLMIFLTWKNGQKTRHETHVVNKKLPQKMLQYYERHIRIVPGDAKPEEE